MTDTYEVTHPHADRVTFYEARRAFADGATVLVTETDEGPFCWVYPSTTTHSRETIEWETLASNVREWRNRYPRQRFYVVAS